MSMRRVLGPIVSAPLLIIYGIAALAARPAASMGALAVTVAVTVLVICTWSTTIASVIPIAARRFGVDPAVVSGPLITTFVDATGLAIYFTIAKMILHI